jgi:hypothetical protein
VRNCRGLAESSLGRHSSWDENGTDRWTTTNHDVTWHTRETIRNLARKSLNNTTDLFSYRRQTEPTTNTDGTLQNRRDPQDEPRVKIQKTSWLDYDEERENITLEEPWSSRSDGRDIVEGTGTGKPGRTGNLFSLFTIVQFK